MTSKTNIYTEELKLAGSQGTQVANDPAFESIKASKQL